MSLLGDSEEPYYFDPSWPITAEELLRVPAYMRNLGEKLYPLIAEYQPQLADKITGMILELDNNELLHLLDNPMALAAKIDEALSVLGPSYPGPKNILGEQLYYRIDDVSLAAKGRNLVGKVTGMLLEFNHHELIPLLDPASTHILRDAVNQCLRALAERDGSAQQVPEQEFSLSATDEECDTKLVLVAGIDKTIDNQALFKKCSLFSIVTDCAIAHDDYGMSLGYGYVLFEDVEGAREAITRMDGMDIGDQPVTMIPFANNFEEELLLNNFEADLFAKFPELLNVMGS